MPTGCFNPNNPLSSQRLVSYVILELVKLSVLTIMDYRTGLFILGKHTYRDPRTACGGESFPSTMWVRQSNLGRQSWQRVPFPAKLSCQPPIQNTFKEKKILSLFLFVTFSDGHLNFLSAEITGRSASLLEKTNQSRF